MPSSDYESKYNRLLLADAQSSSLILRGPAETMLNEFESRTIDWSSYKFLLDAFFRLFEIDRIGTKIQMLRKLGGRQIREVLSENRLSGDEDDTRDESRVFKILEEAFYKPNKVWKKRLEFTCQRQNDGESGADFLARLQDLAKECDFHEAPDRVCEQFIVGVRSEGLRKRLMIEAPGKLSSPVLSAITRLWESTPEDHECDFSQLERAVRHLCSHSTKPTTVRTRKKPEASVSLAPLNRADCEVENLEDTTEAESAVPVYDIPTVAASTTRTLRKRPSPAVRVSAKTETRKKRIPTGSLERTGQKQSSTIRGEEVATDEPIAGKPKVVVTKKKGRPLSAAYVPGGKRFKCDHCEYMSDIRRSILRHERIHTGDRPFKCQFCELRFREKHHVQNHERVHTGETPYICEHCGRGFSKSSTLTDHVRTHTREAPHLCEFCGRGFIQKSALNTHKLIHTGYRPHSCSLCCRGFTTSNLLKTHMKTHALNDLDKTDSTSGAVEASFPVLAEEPYPVSLCAVSYPTSSGVGSEAPTFSRQRDEDGCVPVTEAPAGLEKQVIDSTDLTQRLPDW